MSIKRLRIGRWWDDNRKTRFMFYFIFSRFFFFFPARIVLWTNKIYLYKSFLYTICFICIVILLYRLIGVLCVSMLLLFSSGPGWSRGSITRTNSHPKEVLEKHSLQKYNVQKIWFLYFTYWYKTYTRHINTYVYKYMCTYIHIDTNEKVKKTNVLSKI